MSRAVTTGVIDSAIDITFPGLRIRRVAGHLGGEVLDFKLTPDLSGEAIDALHAALVKHKVLFFRRQAHLDDASHQAFGARFGEVIAHPTVPSPQGTKLFELNSDKGGGRADSWHTDVTFLPVFPKLCILRGVTIPAYGGDTIWANTARAYERLPDDLKKLAERLWALHSNDYDYGAERLEDADSTKSAQRLAHHQQVFVSRLHEAEQPLVHVHPVSGEKSLLLGHFIKRILGLSTAESARLFELFQSRVIRPENTVRWQWQQDDVAIWDNRATQHYAVNDYGSQPRLVRRVAVQGQPAVSVDGKHARDATPESRSAA